jgi:hypothetical protein
MEFVPLRVCCYDFLVSAPKVESTLSTASTSKIIPSLDGMTVGKLGSGLEEDEKGKNVRPAAAPRVPPD